MGIKLRLKTALILWIGVILYSAWFLFSAVSTLKLKLLELEPIAQQAGSVTNLYYLTAFWFLTLGVLLGLGFAALWRK